MSSMTSLWLSRFLIFFLLTDEFDRYQQIDISIGGTAGKYQSKRYFIMWHCQADTRDRICIDQSVVIFNGQFIDCKYNPCVTRETIAWLYCLRGWSSIESHALANQSNRFDCFDWINYHTHWYWFLESNRSLLVWFWALITDANMQWTSWLLTQCCLLSARSWFIKSIVSISRCCHWPVTPSS